MIFHIPGPPVSKPRQTRSDVWKKRPCVLAYRSWADHARDCCRNIPENVVALRITFRLPMPHSWSRKKKESMNNTGHQGKPDIDNCVKACLDALWPKSDGHIYMVSACKLWADPEDACTEIEIMGRKQAA